MPELPEVESVRRSAERALVGRTVIGVCLRRRDIVEGDSGKRALLEGATIVEVRRLGKQLAIVGDDGRVLGVHLGMTGQLLWLAHGARAARTDHVHAEWRLGDAGGRVLFRDPRRFGGLWTFPSVGTLCETRWAALGPDAATITGDALRAALGRSARAVKAGLLDQRALAGVGNIYADEALFAAGIDPRRVCTGIGDGEWDALAAAIRRVLGEAIEAGGSTLRDYRDASGASGSFQTRHLVYGRGGEPCMKCGRVLERFTLGQRTTVACGVCQG